MKQLNPNWLTEGLLDFEYKKYILLAYLKNVNDHFSDNRLYPVLNDLIFHYDNLLTLQNKKEVTTNQFPKKISKLDLENFKIEYERLLDDSNGMEVIQSILDFAIPRIADYLKDGKALYEFVEEQMSIYPLGVVPLNNELGYMFIQESGQRSTKIYEYQITIFENSNENYRGIRTDYVDTYQVSINNTLEKIKLDLINKKKDFPNPATYVIECGSVFPHHETIMPVAKRTFVKYIASL